MPEKYDTDFYETVEDPLKNFRKKYGGAIFSKNDKNIFDNDMDFIQSKKDKEMQEKQSNITLL